MFSGLLMLQNVRRPHGCPTYLVSPAGYWGISSSGWLQLSATPGCHSAIGFARRCAGPPHTKPHAPVMSDVATRPMIAREAPVACTSQGWPGPDRPDRGWLPRQPIGASQRELGQAERGTGKTVAPGAKPGPIAHSPNPRSPETARQHELGNRVGAWQHRPV